MPSLVIGIDPGLTGALAAIDQNGLRALQDMPVMAKGSGAGKVRQEVNPAALSALLLEWTNGQADETMVVVEIVGAMPKQGVATMFSLGDTRGAIRGVVAARGYPMQWAAPGRWKRHFGIGSDKELARAKAIQLYPQADLARKRDHNRAEAILIARWAWEVLR